MKVNKIIIGFVIQTYDTEKNKFIGQEFVGSDDVSWETVNGNTMDTPPTSQTLPTDMIQPTES